MSKSVVHPVHYSIRKPHPLVIANKTELKGIELKIYNEILAHDHISEEGQKVTTYKVPYNVIWPNGNANLSRDKKRIKKALQSKVIDLPKDFMTEYFGQKSDTSIQPFPQLDLYDDCFEVHLWPLFKKMLGMIELTGYTKGDHITLREFNHDVSQSFYWLARNRQSFRQTWQIPLEDFKHKMFIAGYPKWKDFKERVIDCIIEDCEGTWMEFEFDTVKGGRGNKVKDLIFKFKRGPKDEEDAPIGGVFRWEKTLKSLDIGELMIKKIRQYVKAQSEGLSDDGRTWTWDSEYIIYSIEAARLEYHAKESDKKRKRVRDKAAWFVHGLLHGQWLDYVEEHKQYVNEQVQGEIFFKP